MRNARKYVHTGWLLKRLEKLSDMAPTHDVIRILKISFDTAHSWLNDKYFKRAQVAVKGNSQWLWDKDKLRVWLITERAVAMNPQSADMSRENAREALGMPDNYSVRLGRAKIERERHD